MEGRLRASSARVVDELATVRRALGGGGELGLELPNVRIGFACKQRWDDMVGDDRVRACAGCNRPVFNLSEMTRAEAAAVLATRGLTPCVRFYRRPDGTVMTSDCPTRPRRHLAVIASSLAGATLAVAPTAMAEPPPDDSATVDGSDVGSDPSTGSGETITIKMGLPELEDTGGDTAGETGGVTMGVIDITPELVARPAIEWSIWGRLGVGVQSQRSDVAARSITEPAPAAGSTSMLEVAATADVTFGLARDGDVRLGAWGELRTTSGPVAGGELVLEGRPQAHHGTGSVVVRAGANPHVVTGELGVGYVGAYPSSIRWLRHVVGAHVVVSVNRAIDEPHDWSATVGLEVEPIGVAHAIYDLVTGDGN
ncbi:MAG TPA: hypothetical protein VH143_32970 [Kofleriaceae bacterium]|nr:hypothetical protein [Kofleriaceae bacterium]